MLAPSVCALNGNADWNRAAQRLAASLQTLQSGFYDNTGLLQKRFFVRISIWHNPRSGKHFRPVANHFSKAVKRMEFPRRARKIATFPKIKLRIDADDDDGIADFGDCTDRARSVKVAPRMCHL
jgi:hypothetical protein